MNKLKELVLNQDSAVGKAFDWFFQGLIVLSLVIHSLETVPELSKQYQKGLIYQKQLSLSFLLLNTS